MMTYFKNTELARKYNISESTVRNWIRLSKEGRLGLLLTENKGKDYVAKMPSNIPLIERLVEKNRKFRNTRSAKKVVVASEFYSIFEKRYIYDIIRNLELQHEIPRQYNYFADGADRWDGYAVEQIYDSQPNMLKATIELLAQNHGYLEGRLSAYDSVNVVDIGMGNALPCQGLLSRLHLSGRLARYVAVDLSPRMISIAQGNLRSWFGDEFPFESLQKDIRFERFPEAIMDEYLSRSASGERVGNLFLLLGATPSNFARPDDAYRTICESMQPGDLLVATDKLETSSMMPEWYKYDCPPSAKFFELTPRHRYILDLIGIDPQFYDAEVGYNPTERYRYVKVRLKVSLTIIFRFDTFERTVSFEKGDAILLWRSWQMNTSEVSKQFDSSGFYTLHSSQTDDHEYIMTVAEVKRD